MFSPFFFNSAQVFFEQPVRDGYILFVPTIIASLVSSDEQYRCAPRIERIQHPERVSARLRT